MKCLFWNIRRTPENIVTLLKKAQEPYDLIFLAETITLTEKQVKNIGNPSLLVEIQKDIDKFLSKSDYSTLYCKCPDQGSIMSILIRSSLKSGDFSRMDRADDRLRMLAVSYQDKYLFCMAHFPSLLSVDNDTLLAYAIETAKEIKRIEDVIFLDKLLHTKTLLVGDFNMNPYHQGMLHPMGFNAPFAKETVGNRSYKKLDVKFIQYKLQFPFFYNLTWRFLGQANERADKISSSIKVRGRQVENEIFKTRNNFFDQLLIRPDLILDFDEKTFNFGEYLDSDHRPITFTLNINT